MSQSLAKILLHIIFSTKGRIKYLTGKARNELYPYMLMCLKNQNCFTYAIGGMEDHIHILCEIPKTASICKVIEKTKTSSSIMIKKILDNAKNFHWQSGYGVFSVSWSNLQVVVRYIENQAKHHKTLSFQDELKLLLEKNQIDYDEKFLWD